MIGQNETDVMKGRHLHFQGWRAL